MAQTHQRPRSMRVPDIRKGDQVLVLTGKEAGKKGTVEHVVRNRQGFKKTVSKYGSNWRKHQSAGGRRRRGRGPEHRQAAHQAAPQGGQAPNASPASSRAASSTCRSRSWRARSWSSARTAASRRASSTASPATADRCACAPTAARRSCARCASDRRERADDSDTKSPMGRRPSHRRRLRPPSRPGAGHRCRGASQRCGSRGHGGGTGVQGGCQSPAKSACQGGASRRGHHAGEWTGLRRAIATRSCRRCRRSSTTRNPMQVPRLTKIVVNIGMGEALDERQGARRRGRRPGPDHRPEADRDQRPALDRAVPTAHRQPHRRQGHAARRAHVGLPRATDAAGAAAHPRLPRRAEPSHSTDAATTRSGCASSSRSRRSTTTRSTGCAGSR